MLAYNCTCNAAIFTSLEANESLRLRFYSRVTPSTAKPIETYFHSLNGGVYNFVCVAYNLANIASIVIDFVANES